MVIQMHLITLNSTLKYRYGKFYIMHVVSQYKQLTKSHANDHLISLCMNKWKKSDEIKDPLSILIHFILNDTKYKCKVLATVIEMNECFLYQRIIRSLKGIMTILWFKGHLLHWGGYSAFMSNCNRQSGRSPLMRTAAEKDYQWHFEWTDSNSSCV